MKRVRIRRRRAKIARYRLRSAAEYPENLQKFNSTLSCISFDFVPRRAVRGQRNCVAYKSIKCCDGIDENDLQMLSFPYAIASFGVRDRILEAQKVSEG